MLAKLRSLWVMSVVAVLLLGAVLWPFSFVATTPTLAASVETQAVVTPSIRLTAMGTYKVPAGGGTSEIVTFDPQDKMLYVANGVNKTIDVLSAADPMKLTLVRTIPISSFGGGVNSVAFHKGLGLVAAAIESDPKQLPGKVVFFDRTGTMVKEVTVGALPDMVMFSPNGKYALVANEGEPDVTYSNDPEGSVSIIDVSNGVATATAMTADFKAYIGQENMLRARGVRLFGPKANAAQDLEPEYITVSPDGKTAKVTLQENNAMAVIDIATAKVKDIIALGAKNHAKGQPTFMQYPFNNLPDLGQTAAVNPTNPLSTTTAQTIKLGGFSGLYFEGMNGANYKFVTLPDRGPNGEPTDVDHDGADERPFALPNYQARVLRFEFNPTTGALSLTQQLLLKQTNGISPITGLPNIPVQDEEPVDLWGNALPYDPMGADMEAIVVNPTDGTYWMVDEYRPAIYQFGTDGVMLKRLVPTGTAALAGQPVGTYGSETLPADYIKRRGNRGFEGMALDTDSGILYAFIQTPLNNPTSAAGGASQVIRMLGINPSTGQAVAEYVYLLENSSYRSSKVDKIGDTTYAGQGRFYVVERDSDTTSSSKKLVFEADLLGATNLLGSNPPTLLAGKTLEQHTPDDLVKVGVKPLHKEKVLNLASLAGYNMGEKVEGLTVLPTGQLAIVNDNDFSVMAAPIKGDGTVPMTATPAQEFLGVISFGAGNELDASNKDSKINLKNWPVYGLYMPDAIDVFTSAAGAYYVTANEGDARNYTDAQGKDVNYDEARVKDLTLNPAIFTSTDLIKEEQLGRLKVTTATVGLTNGDFDGDGQYDRLYSFGARSFSIWDEYGNLVYDSSSQLERITAADYPAVFNDSGDGKFDDRSDDKGPEPEGVTIGTIEGRTYAFIGLERIGGIMVYDITDPYAVQFVQYINTRSTKGDIAPEGLKFIAAADSPTGQPMLAVAYEVSNSVTLFQIGQPTAYSGQYMKTAMTHSTTITPLLTVGQMVSRTSNIAQGYRMVGLPDGLGAYKAADQSIHLFMNHELGYKQVVAPIVGGAVVTGAFVSEFIWDTQGKLVSGDLAFNKVQTWNGTTFEDKTATWLAGTTTFGRFCSGSLAGTAEGLSNPIYLTGEESGGVQTFDGLGAVGVAVISGTAYIVPEWGHYSKENIVVLPHTGQQTVVMITEDGPSGLDSQLWLYVGMKNLTSSNPLVKAGLIGGELYVFKSTTTGKTNEDTFHKADGEITGEWLKVSSTLQNGEVVRDLNETTLDLRVKAAGSFNFVRLEDGEADKTMPGVFYFNSTGSITKNVSGGYINKLGRTYRLKIDPTNPITGTTTLQILLEGDAGDPVVNPDNMAVNANGQMMIQEDPNGEHRGDGLLNKLGRDSSVWLYDLPGDGMGQDGVITRAAEIDQTAIPEAMRNVYGEWETSGIIDASGLFGPGTWLFDVQAHSVNSLQASQLQGSATDMQVAEGGQLVLLHAPVNPIAVTLRHNYLPIIRK